MRRFVQLTQGLAAVSSVIFAFLAIGTLTDVIGRTVFDNPLPGVVDLAALCLVLSVFLSLGQAEVTEAHVRMKLVTVRLKPRWQRNLQTFAMLISAAFLGLMVWGSYLRLIRSYNSREELFGTIPLLIWPFRFVIVAGVFILACACLLKAYRHVSLNKKLKDRT